MNGYFESSNTNTNVNSKTFVWIVNNSILSVVKSNSEANAWEKLKDTDIGVYDRLSMWTDNFTEEPNIIRPTILEEYTNECICSAEEYEIL